MSISFSPTGVISCTGIEVGNTGISFTPDYTVKCNSIITNNTGISFSPNYDISCRSATMGNITLSDSGISGLTYYFQDVGTISDSFYLPDRSIGSYNRIEGYASNLVRFYTRDIPITKQVLIIRSAYASNETNLMLGTASETAGNSRVVPALGGRGDYADYFYTVPASNYFVLDYIIMPS